MVGLAIALTLVGAAPGTVAAGGPAVCGVAATPGSGGTAPQPAPPFEVVVTRDVPYGEDGQEHLLLDAYVPKDGRSSRPAIVLVHGGGWEVGDKSGPEPYARALAAQGFAAFSIGYSLESQFPWPDELEDVRQSVRWLQDNAARFGIDRDRMGMFGGSAGAHLAMLVATGGVGEGYRPVRAVASWSGPTDLRTLAPPNLTVEQLRQGTVPGSDVPVGCGTNPNCVGRIAPSVITRFLACTIEECAKEYAKASPVTQVSDATPPMFLASSQEDLVPASQAYEMANALNEHGVVSVLLVVPGDRHADAYADVALAPTIAFLQTYVAQGADPRIPPKSPPTTVAGSAPLPPLTDGWKLPAADEQLPVRLRGWRVWETVRWVLLGLVVAGVTIVVVVRRRADAREGHAPV